MLTINNIKTRLLFIITFVSLFFLTTVSAQTQYCILKADDFEYSESDIKGVHPVYLKYINYIIEKNIVSGIGIIGYNWDHETLRSDHLSFIESLQSSGKFEFWNHGYDHLWGENGNYEFKNKPYDYQYSQMIKTQKLIKEKLGISMHSFGAPGNAADITTTSVLYNVEELKVWMYNRSTPAAPGVLPLPIETSIEWWNTNDGSISPDLTQFKYYYDIQGHKEPYLLCQLHPHRYDNEAFAQLDSTIEFLLSKNVKFVLPYDYYLIKANGLIADAGPDTTIGSNPATINIGSLNTSDDASSYKWTSQNGHIVSGAKERIATVDKPGTYKLTVKRTGSFTITDAVIVSADTTTSLEAEDILPNIFSISVYPNPFNPTTTVNFTIPNDSKVKIDIYNSLGQKVAELVNSNHTKGSHSISWNAIGFSSGTYFAKFTAIDLYNNKIHSDVKKLILLK